MQQENRWVIRYQKFINYAKHRQLPLNQFYETHHIKPRSQGGDNSKDNLIKLTLREHFLAHYILAKAYPKHLGLVSAFVQMCNKNFDKLGYDFIIRKYTTSKMYSAAKTNLYNMISVYNAGFVNAVDSMTGESIRVTSEEYRNRPDLIHHMTGKVAVRDEYGDKIIMSSEEYENSDYSFHTTGMVRCKDVDDNSCWVTSEEYQKGKGTKYFISNDQSLTVLDKLTGDMFDVKLFEWQNDPRREETYKVKLSNKKRYIITNKRVKNYGRPCLGMVKVFKEGETKESLVTKEEFEKNRHLYRARNEGKKIALDPNGNPVYVDADVDLPGVTKGMTSVKLKATGEFVQISVDEFKQNKHLYAGPCTGKKNIRSIYKPGYYQVDKEYQMKDGDVTPRKYHWVHNPTTKEEKQISKTEYVGQEWKLGRLPEDKV